MILKPFMIRLLPGFTYILMSPLIHTQCISGEIWQVLWVMAQLPHGIRRCFSRRQAITTTTTSTSACSLSASVEDPTFGSRNFSHCHFPRFSFWSPTASPRVVPPSSLCSLYDLYWGFFLGWGGEGGLVIWDAAMPLPSGNWGSWPCFHDGLAAKVWGPMRSSLEYLPSYQFQTFHHHHHTFDFLSFTLYIFTQNMKLIGAFKDFWKYVPPPDLFGEESGFPFSKKHIFFGWVGEKTHQPQELRAKQTAPSDSCASPVVVRVGPWRLNPSGSRCSYREHLY